jgi:hypothetical protein
MGTNFYAKIIPSIEDIEEYKKAIQEKDMGGILKFEEARSESLVHLGKRSAGRPFIWDYNHYDYYDPNKESITKFVMNPNIIIIDEYDTVMDNKEFLEMAFNWCNNKKNLLNSENCYFFNDGLTFFRYTEFS